MKSLMTIYEVHNRLTICIQMGKQRFPVRNQVKSGEDDEHVMKGVELKAIRHTMD